MPRYLSPPLLACVLATTISAAEPAKFLSHPPARPLPVASERPLAGGPAYFVDAAKGSDAAAGTKNAPWKTLGHAVTKLVAGDTLVLRGGVYHEHLTARLNGTANKPITIRAYPGELPILDGGLPEFLNTPAMAWEACPGGVAGEFQSTKTYPGLGEGAGDGPAVYGNFGDSLVPLAAYRFHGDLQSNNLYWNVENKVGTESFIYCGPGIWYDPATGRIHCRLAPMNLPGLADDNYRGVADPRQVPLVVAGIAAGPVLTLVESQHVRLWDVVLRGAGRATLNIETCRNIELDGLTAYGGHPPIRVMSTAGLRMQHTACRGMAAPWTSRAALKYRSVESRLFSGNGWDPTGDDSRNFEIRYSEFTDSCDGVFLGNVRGVRFHHNLVENVTDDGLFLTAGTGYDGATHGGDVQIYQNRFARILTCFAFGVGHGRQKVLDLGNGLTGKQTGSGVFIFRNVFDLRRPVWYQWPTSSDGPQEITSRGRFAGDHGSPSWEPMWIYHNTVLAGDTPRYGYGADGFNGGLGRGTSRRIFNNIICLTSGIPGSTLPQATVDFAADGNLLWSLEPMGEIPTDLFRKFRASPELEASKAKYPTAWTTHDLVADPRLEKLSADWRLAADLRPGKGSPAIDAGVVIPAEWPDPLRPADAGQPDLGAIPTGGSFANIGVSASRTDEKWHYTPQPQFDYATRPKALIVEGYPAFDAPIFAYLLRKAGYAVETCERAWFDMAKLASGVREHPDGANQPAAGQLHREADASRSPYRVVIYDGSLTRAKVAKTAFSAEDVSHVRAFLEGGGTLVITRERGDLFTDPEGRKLLNDLVGSSAATARDAQPVMSIRQPDHPWLKSLAGQADLPWLSKGGPLRTTTGQSLIGSDKGSSILHHAKLGGGQFVYIGWSPAASIPNGREKTAAAAEQVLEAQVAIVREILNSSVVSGQ